MRRAVLILWTCACEEFDYTMLVILDARQSDPFKRDRSRGGIDYALFVIRYVPPHRPIRPWVKR